LWRQWLQDNHEQEQAVWLVFYSKKSGRKSISWREAVDVALCFGWIDSKKIKIDAETSHQFFSKRKALSTWSKINKDIIQGLIEQKLMTEAGFKSIAIAKENGYWKLDGDKDSEPFYYPNSLINEEKRALTASAKEKNFNDTPSRNFNNFSWEGEASLVGFRNGSWSAILTIRWGFYSGKGGLIIPFWYETQPIEFNRIPQQIYLK
jgi:uncharacterized protein YdeI (YjbR/CyaY-like superfamily)